MITLGNESTNQLRPAEQYNYVLTLNGPEFGWEFLRRHQAYQAEYSIKNPKPQTPRRLASGTLVWRDNQSSEARKWGLCSFRRPSTARA
jgi:Family of unknown function (DUF6499)